MLWTVSNGMTARLQKLKSRTAINLKVGTNEQQNIIINPIITLGTLFTNAQSLSGFQWGKGWELLTFRGLPK